MKDLSKYEGRFISLAWFKAYDRELSEFWLDDKQPLQEQIELRIITICKTAIIHHIKIIDTKTP